MDKETLNVSLSRDLLRQLDDWRYAEADNMSRHEALVYLVGKGLKNVDDERSISSGEKLTIMMLADLLEGTGVRTEIETDFLKEVITGGHYWALEWEMMHIFHGAAHTRKDVKFVVDVLDMWEFIEESAEELNPRETDGLVELVGPIGKRLEFIGFDGNNETDYRTIALFLIENMGRFERYKGRNLNSHSPKAEQYEKMLGVFKSIRPNLINRLLTVEEISEILPKR